jgi:hypothetical protein
LSHGTLSGTLRILIDISVNCNLLALVFLARREVEEVEEKHKKTKKTKAFGFHPIFVLCRTFQLTLGLGRYPAAAAVSKFIGEEGTNGNGAHNGSNRVRIFALTPFVCKGICGPVAAVNLSDP